MKKSRTQINLTVGKKPLLEKVLRAICGQTLRHSQNDGVRKLLGASRRQLAECGQFEEGDDSFLANLRTYLGRLKEYAQGKIDRVVLVFDEFDKLLEEYRGRREEVEELTNQLRHAGTEDEDIGILLAGSELMRQLVGHPRNALYGSATQVVLKCFDSVQDRNLAREIVAPQRLMGRRVFARRIVETIVEHTGGHPLFMRIVGCVCSHIAKRRQVSHGIVMDGISRLVNNDVLRGYLPDPVNVIKQQLQALRLLDREDAIRAELLLLRLAQRTTLDQPRVVWGALRHDDKLLTVAPAEAWVRARDGTREAELIVVDGAYLRFRHGLLGEVLRSDAEWGFERLSVELGDLRSRRGDAGVG